MTAVLLELSEVLRSKTDEDKITNSERMLIGNCMVKSVKNCLIGAFVSSAVVYSATRRLGRWYRFYLSAAMLIGRLLIDRSANSCLEHILSIEEIHCCPYFACFNMQFHDSILWKHRESPSRMQLVHKYFYPEVVFTDLKPDEPLIRLRARNAYEDQTASGRTEDNDGSCDDVDAKTQSTSQSKRNPSNANTSQSNPGEDLLADPLEFIIFGNQEPSEQIRADGAENPRSRRRAHRTARRHHRDHHTETHSHSTEG
ncbi:uncharacterized protein LOC110032433 isoform X2 [Phalaenopsis equestris]|uniref:uncharacterized protein LOC110032433 isoform X2 n=1 Tax=Phalaenopsis equestris TaxID=78828 RepID=UPI0009E1E3DA|nr:uncharacterized protein LOC110032433 isoform X2 [Phalaenopsis equestris]